MAATHPLANLLRRATAAHHGRAERAFDLPRRLLNDAAWAELLRTLLRIHEPFEISLGTRLAGLGLPHASERMRAPLLRDDLRAAGESASPRSTDGPLLATGDEATLVGRLYVLEGSSLGGTIVAREVRRALGFSAHHGASFFAARGRDTRVLWSEFLDWAEERVVPDERRRCVEAACATFDVVTDQLSRTALEAPMVR